MRILLSWLKDYVEVPFSVEELAERLPMLGIGVESVERFGDDAVLDLEIAANRGDLMCVVGVAREMAAATRGQVRLSSGDPVEDAAPVTELARVEVANPVLCPRYTARVIVDVRVGSSPAWMARRLDACGIRSINNIVDVTNYVMLELGQPMHAFDYDRLAGGRIIVRGAKAGEPLMTLDGMDRRLDPDTLVIADADRAVGIGGVIGGANTEIDTSTRRVLLEAASFNPASIRRTSKRLGVRTESSARFERGVDTDAVLRASARAIRLMHDVAGGRILRGAVDVYPAPQRIQRVELRWPNVARLLGMEVPLAEGVAILRSLGFAVEGPDQILRVQVPTFRRDVEREEDLIEEVARHYGYEHIPEAMPVEVTAQGSVAPEVQADQAVRDIMIRAGWIEALTVALNNPTVLDNLMLPDDHPWRQAIRLRNPLVEDHTHLRTTLLPGLLDVARVNVARRTTDFQIFEVGRTFHPTRDGGVTEQRRLGAVATGRWLRGTWNMPAEAATASYYYLKGALESLLQELHVSSAVFTPASVTWLHPGRAAQVSIDGEAAGTIGELHPDVASRYDLPAAVYVMEVFLDALLRRAVFRPRFTSLPRFPAVRRDLAVVAPVALPAQTIEAALTSAGGNLLEAVELFDVYTGPPIPAGRRNLAYALSFRSAERTLSADEVDAVLRGIKEALTRQLRVKIRE